MSHELAHTLDELTLAASGEERFIHEIAFVNRYAESLDVLFPNLINQEALRVRDTKVKAKMKTPLAVQPQGTGKTALGANLIAVLQRPREGEDFQREVARRLLNAWSWRGAMHNARISIEKAIADTSADNLVMRTLRVCFPHHAHTLERLKSSTPIMVQMRELSRPGTLLGFDDALGHLIFVAATGQKSARAYIAFVADADLPRGSDGVVEALIRKYGPLLIVLDDVTDLALKQFEPYFGTENPSLLHNAMSELSICLQRLHAIEGCFLFCTGRSVWLSAQALVRTSSLLVSPLFLTPLSAGDVLETLHLTGSGSMSTLERDVGVVPSMLPFLAERARSVTGGMGRPLQLLLRELQRDAVGRPLADEHSKVDAALERVRGRLSEVAGLVLRVSWDGPAAAAGDVPDALQGERQQLRLMRVFARALLLDSPFAPSLDVVLGPDAHVKFSDAAVVLGLSFAPYTPPPSLSSPASSDGSTDTSESSGGRSSSSDFVMPPTLLRLVAGDWLCRSLLTDPRIATDQTLLATSMFLDTMRTFGGTMRGRPFELLCIDALCARSMLNPGAPLQMHLPHLGVSVLRDVHVPRLSVVAIPKVTSKTSKLDEDARALLLHDQNHWPGDRKTLHPADLEWLLSAWVRVGTIAVPADALGGTQDWFVRLGESDYLGVANKADSGTAWADLKKELHKTPRLPTPARYALVIWSLNLAPQLRTAIGDAEACVYGSGPWFFKGGRLTQEASQSNTEPEFHVPERFELIIVNPHDPSGGGLLDLLGSVILVHLRTICSAESAPLDVPGLLAWMS